MRPFRNNNKRSRYRHSGERNFKRNGENQSFSNNVNFQRKSPGRNNQNASKLIEKYTDLAREALSNNDKILSENYFQHADHFIRIQSEKEKNRIVQNDTNKITNEENNKVEDQVSKEKIAISN
tara:strand:+ start:1166 stop:1534 length:369 start_codon:yes stop_codon:yes gene_type:complete